MTALLLVDRDTGRTFARFVLDDISGDADDEVSVVGSFNDWVPGVHTLTRQDDGTRSVVAEVRQPGDVHFRYLAVGGRWFDDPSAHRIDEHGSTLLRDSAQPTEVFEAKQTGKKADKRKKAHERMTARKTKKADEKAGKSKADKKAGTKKRGKTGRKKA